MDGQSKGDDGREDKAQLLGKTIVELLHTLNPPVDGGESGMSPSISSGQRHRPALRERGG